MRFLFLFSFFFPLYSFSQDYSVLNSWFRSPKNFGHTSYYFYSKKYKSEFGGCTHSGYEKGKYHLSNDTIYLEVKKRRSNIRNRRKVNNIFDTLYLTTPRVLGYKKSKENYHKSDASYKRFNKIYKSQKKSVLYYQLYWKWRDKRRRGREKEK